MPDGPCTSELGEAYNPDTLKLLARAFDTAWRDIKTDGLGTGAEDRRNCLALIILALAREGMRDEREIKNMAVRYVTPAGTMRH
jgi:hypothetical protein